IQRAAAEQSRRVADCLRAFQETLLETIAQPCFLMDIEGSITYRNPSMTRWMGIGAPQEQTLSLQELLPEEAGENAKKALRAVVRAVRKSGEKPSTPFLLSGPLAFRNGQTAEVLTLLPQCRIPGCVEAILVLITPCA